MIGLFESVSRADSNADSDAEPNSPPPFKQDYRSSTLTEEERKSIFDSHGTNDKHVAHASPRALLARAELTLQLDPSCPMPCCFAEGHGTSSACRCRGATTDERHHDRPLCCCGMRATC